MVTKQLRAFPRSVTLTRLYGVRLPLVPKAHRPPPPTPSPWSPRHRWPVGRWHRRSRPAARSYRTSRSARRLITIPARGRLAGRQRTGKHPPPPETPRPASPASTACCSPAAATSPPPLRGRRHPRGGLRRRRPPGHLRPRSRPYRTGLGSGAAGDLPWSPGRQRRPRRQPGAGHGRPGTRTPASRAPGGDRAGHAAGAGHRRAEGGRVTKTPPSRACSTPLCAPRATEATGA